MRTEERSCRFWQWFGSSLQLAPHLHLLVAGALWRDGGAGRPPFGDEDVARILARVLRAAKKDGADHEAAWSEDENELLQQRSIQDLLGFGEAPAPHHRAHRLAFSSHCCVQAILANG